MIVIQFNTKVSLYHCISFFSFQILLCEVDLLRIHVQSYPNQPSLPLSPFSLFDILVFYLRARFLY